ncbi:lysozyme 2-like [Bacillus rossius redtenbacheri]|uniref:lysozyme 2-like n=1 Tax=Bacillus rossius redtenbacheri TaxID=93214 RepID=UPI002FDE9117
MLRLALGVLLVAAVCSGVFVSNLDRACLRCLCEAASGCNETAGCHQGYCGPFWVSRIYWAEAGKVVFPDDDPERPEAYQDCANSYDCAAGIVEHYMAAVGKDCDGDGVTDCDDYAAIHYNGAYSCARPLRGTAFLARYDRCRPTAAPGRLPPPPPAPQVQPPLFPGGYLGAPAFFAG